MYGRSIAALAAAMRAIVGTRVRGSSDAGIWLSPNKTVPVAFAP